MSSPLLAAAVVGNGLLAGLFLAFVVAVSPGLRRVDDAAYVATFRAVNAAILSLVFLAVFLGTPVVTLGAAVLGGHDRSWLLVGAAGAAATFLVTAAGNVPLNTRLAAAPVHTAAERADARRRFEARWNRWNVVRATTSTLALAALAGAAVS